MPTFNAKLLVLVIGVCLFWQSALAATDDYANTRYPIMLVHGMGNLDFHGVDYWYGVRADLVSHGAVVFEAELAAFDNETVRGEQLVRQIRNVLALTGARKVNLIGHSQGGLSSRYAAAIMPQAVASITTIGTPHRGSPVPGNKLVRVIADLFWNQGGSYGGTRALDQLSEAGVREFNANFPSAGLSADCRLPGKDVDIVKVTDSRTGKTQSYTHALYSWAGSKRLTNPFDFIDIAFSITQSDFQPGEANDGLVSVCSASFGKVIGTYPWNHGDEINQYKGMLGLLSLGQNNAANPVVVIRTHANRLKLAGL